jgi:hypothetical protein
VGRILRPFHAEHASMGERNESLSQATKGDDDGNSGKG